jgi:tetratricopeptide (TPR) repeat protein
VKWLFAVLIAAATLAANAQTAKQLYIAGKYEQAETRGVAENSAEGLTYAARAVLAHDQMGAPCLECLKRAESYARRAVAADSDYSDAHIYLAAALGFQGRIVGIIKARIDNYPEEAKANIDAALKTDPNSARALAALGGWNIEVVRAGGETMAKMIYGASIDEGQKAFARAFATSPHDLVVRFQHALVLSAYDPNRFHDAIAESLNRAISEKPKDAFDVFEIGRAHELLAALKRGDMDVYAKLVRRDQGYPD